MTEMEYSVHRLPVKVTGEVSGEMICGGTSTARRN